MGGAAMIALLKAGDDTAQADVQPFAQAASVRSPTACILPLQQAAPAASPIDLRLAQREQEVEDLHAQLEHAALAAETRDAEA